ncbi:MAG: gas vesicle protein GvpG [Nanoarchaeota archaeon]
MFLIDDFLIWLSETMRDFALKEKYNLKEINNKIKENRLHFEIKEITEKEYKKRHKILLEELENAKDATERMSEIKINELQH